MTVADHRCKTVLCHRCRMYIIPDNATQLYWSVRKNWLVHCSAVKNAFNIFPAGNGFGGEPEAYSPAEAFILF